MWNAILLSGVSTCKVINIPFPLYNDLSAAVLRFGRILADKIQIVCHLDICAAMNTENLHLHQWIMANYLHIVDSYEQYDDAKPFNPITLDCAVPSSDTENTANKLTVVVTYKTILSDNNGKKT